MGNCLSSKKKEDKEFDDLAAQHPDGQAQSSGNSSKLDVDALGADAGSTTTPKSSGSSESTNTPQKPKSNFVIGQTHSIEKDFELLETLGKGQFGEVRRARDRKTGEILAVKVCLKDKYAQFSHKQRHFELLRHEVLTLTKVDHPNIIKLAAVYESAPHFSIVMECCTGGELLVRIQKLGNYSESAASILLRQVASALQHLHARQIVHCDLKPENIIFATMDEDSELKLIDFGLAKTIEWRQYFDEMCGTPYYVAPEVLSGHYNEACDLWSMGVIMFVMLFGFPPFFCEDQALTNQQRSRKIYDRIRRGFCPEVRPNYGPWFPASSQISESARDLISKLLINDVAERFTAEEALQHPWLKGETASTEPIDKAVLQSVTNFVRAPAFKNVVLDAMILSEVLDPTQMEALKKTFATMDTDGNGTVSHEELRAAMQKLEGKKISDEDVDKIIKNVDVDGDGEISYHELCMTRVNHKLEQKEERLRKAFKEFDADGNGTIDAAELGAILEKASSIVGDMNLSPEALIKEVDRDGNGVIDLEEFIQLFRKDYKEGENKRIYTGPQAPSSPMP